MKMFAWHPKGHGELTFVVMSETKEDAQKAIEEFMAEGLNTKMFTKYSWGGWGTDYYMSEVFGPNEVFTNEND